MTSNLLDEGQLPGEFAIYQRFNRVVDMEEVVELLRSHQIQVRVSGEDAGEWREANIIGSPLQPKFWIEIPANQFEKANYLLQDVAEATISDEDLKAHPFSDYSTKELQEVLIEESSWSPDAVVVARKLLLKSGEDVDLQALRRIARQRMEEAYTPKQANWLIVSFFTLYGGFAALSVWIASLLIALGVVLYYVVGSRRDPKGAKHWAYNRESRAWGRASLVVIAICWLFGVVNLFYLKWVAFPPIDVWYWIWF